MRNMRPTVGDAERPTALSPASGPSLDPIGRPDPTRDTAVVDAPIMQILRDRWRTSRSLESVAGEIVRLGTLAAAVHRAAAIGTTLAVDGTTRPDVPGVEAEDAA